MSALPRLYVFGAGGHGKVVAEAAARSGLYDVVGFLDDDRAKWRLRLLERPVVGGLEALPRAPVAVALGVGSNRDRLELLRRLERRGACVVAVVHPSATVASGVTLEAGSYVGPGALVHVDARVGRACIVNSGAIVEHDDVLADGVHVSPRAALGGHVEIGEGAHVGLGAVVLPGLSVGAWSVVGAGAVVTRSLPGGIVAVGIPARIQRGADPAALAM